MRACLVLGSQKELLHLASLSQACANRSDIHIQLAVCESLLGSLSEFSLPYPTWVLKERGTKSFATAIADGLFEFDRSWTDAAPDCVVIHGSGQVAWTAALTAASRQIPVVHVDPLHSQRQQPRPQFQAFLHRSAGWMASMHCAPNRQTAQQLIVSGQPRHTVFITGHTAVETLRWLQTKSHQQSAEWHERHAWLLERPYVICERTQAATSKAALDAEWQLLNRLAACHPEIQFAVMMPVDNEAAPTHHHSAMNVQWIRPQTFAEGLWLKSKSRLVLSDSDLGHDVQLAYGVPVVDWDCSQSPVEMTTALKTASELLRQPVSAAQYLLNSDGKAAERIIDLLAARAWNEPMTVRRAA